MLLFPSVGNREAVVSCQLPAFFLFTARRGEGIVGTVASLGPRYVRVRWSVGRSSIPGLLPPLFWCPCATTTTITTPSCHVRDRPRPPSPLRRLRRGLWFCFSGRVGGGNDAGEAAVGSGQRVRGGHGDPRRRRAGASSLPQGVQEEDRPQALPRVYVQGEGRGEGGLVPSEATAAAGAALTHVFFDYVV